MDDLGVPLFSETSMWNKNFLYVSYCPMVKKNLQYISMAATIFVSGPAF